MWDTINEIKDGLWLGDNYAANNVVDLKKKGIKKILTVMNQTGPIYKSEDGFIHKKFELSDFESENIIKYFGECLNFIDGDEKVLVHCMHGQSRSATIVIAYLMWKKKMNYDEAFTFVNNKREIFPNEGFIEQLKLFGKLLEENDYDINKINFKEINWKRNDEK